MSSHSGLCEHVPALQLADLDQGSYCAHVCAGGCSGPVAVSCRREGGVRQGGLSRPTLEPERVPPLRLGGPGLGRLRDPALDPLTWRCVWKEGQGGRREARLCVWGYGTREMRSFAESQPVPAPCHRGQHAECMGHVSNPDLAYGRSKGHVPTLSACLEPSTSTPGGHLSSGGLLLSTLRLREAGGAVPRALGWPGAWPCPQRRHPLPFR